MIPILIDHVESVIKKTEVRTHVSSFIADASTKLQGIIDGTFPKPKRKPKTPIIPKKLVGKELLYIETLKKGLGSIVLANPTQLQQYKTQFDGIIPAKVISGKLKKKFRGKILQALGYEVLRSVFYPGYFQKLGIKACIYCNSQLTVSAEGTERWVTPKLRLIRSNPTLSAKFQVDHIIPKSDYPCLSISFFNLYPVCGSCNNVKSTIPVDVQLYTDDKSRLGKSDFKFRLADGCVAKYISTFKKEHIKVIFEDPNNHYLKTKSNGREQDIFDIEGIYATQDDLAEELIIKSYIYKDAYKKRLLKSFNRLFTNASLSNRLLIGNYIEPENAHKRPMAKFTQDIARQLKMIK